MTLPKLAQTVVTGHKLTLAQAIVSAEVDQATLALMNERYAVIAAVRAAFYDVYMLERRIEALGELLKLADDAVKNGKNLLDNQRIARLDLVQLQIERERFRADAEAAERELPSARRALAAAVGDPRMNFANLVGSYENLPLYDPDRSLDLVLSTHPEVRAAQVGVERAQAAIRRAKAEVIPNLNVYTGYIRQYENQSHVFAIGVNGYIPVWNRNQGNIRAAQAELGVASQEVGRVQNDLTDRVATAYRLYAAARRRAEIYRANPSVAEGLLIERGAATWLHLHYQEMHYACQENKSELRNFYYQRIIYVAQQRYFAALVLLRDQRKVLPPSVQINVANEQVNVASNASPAPMG